MKYCRFWKAPSMKFDSAQQNYLFTQHAQCLIQPQCHQCIVNAACDCLTCTNTSKGLTADDVI